MSLFEYAKKKASVLDAVVDDAVGLHEPGSAAACAAQARLCAGHGERSPSYYIISADSSHSLGLVTTRPAAACAAEQRARRRATEQMTCCNPFVRMSSTAESSVANLAASGVSSGCAQPAPIRRFGGERGSRRFDPTSSERERFLAEPEMVLAAPCRARLWLSARFFAPALVLSARARGVKQRTLSRESLPEPRPGPPDLECPRGVTVLVMCLSTLSPASKEPCCDSYSISQCTCDRARAPAR